MSAVRYDTIRLRLARVAQFIAGNNALADRMLKEIAEYAIAGIKTRTESGVDVEGQAFKDYDAAYKRWRQKKGKPVDRVRLALTGQMQGDVKWLRKANNNILLQLATGETARRAMYQQGARRWFALSSADRDGIMEIFNRYASGVVNGE